MSRRPPISSLFPYTTLFRSDRWWCAADTALTTTPRSTTSSPDRKSTRLNSSHLGISYAVFCLKKIHDQPSVAHIAPMRERIQQPPGIARVQPEGRFIQHVKHPAFFFNDTAPTEIYPLSLPGALPI